MGAAGSLGRSWIYLTIPIFHFGFMYTLFWELGRGIITLPKDLWLSSQSPGPNGAAIARKQIGSALPAEL